MPYQYNQHILLTGAGFTKNIGGLLAKEMWSKIFNNPLIQQTSRVKQILLNNYDYESVYYSITNGDHTIQEKEAINHAILNAYRILDDIVREWTFRNGSPYPVNIYGVNKFLDRFSGLSNGVGFIFTLNQDLFLERHHNSSNCMLTHPGVPKIPNAHTIILRLPMEVQDFIKVPTNEERCQSVNPISPRTLNYIKLHGSYGWLSSTGTNCYVIGRNKEDQINAEPLLSYYFDLFTEELSKPDRKLLVIGYGFCDDHINSVLANSIIKHGLKLFIISPGSQSDTFNKIKTLDIGETILNGISGYFPYSLLEVFPEDQSDSHAWREIIESYFGS